MLFIALTVTLIVRYNGCCSSPHTRYEHKLQSWLTGRSVGSPTDINPGATLKWQPQIGPPLLWKSPEENPTVSYRAILAGVRVPLSRPRCPSARLPTPRYRSVRPDAGRPLLRLSGVQEAQRAVWPCSSAQTVLARMPASRCVEVRQGEEEEQAH